MPCSGEPLGFPQKLNKDINKTNVRAPVRVSPHVGETQSAVGFGHHVNNRLSKHGGAAQPTNHDPKKQRALFSSQLMQGDETGRWGCMESADRQVKCWSHAFTNQSPFIPDQGYTLGETGKSTHNHLSCKVCCFTRVTAYRAFWVHHIWFLSYFLLKLFIPNKSLSNKTSCFVFSPSFCRWNCC